MSESKILRLRLDDRLYSGLDKLAKSTKRSRSFVATEAIRRYLGLNDWQIEEIQKGLAEAKRGEFAKPADVARLRNKWR
jgi:RHH-type transcriptional regulator, rel operon repressor / antitoxin RelB